jgi:hypothetical protein
MASLIAPPASGPPNTLYFKIGRASVRAAKPEPNARIKIPNRIQPNESELHTRVLCGPEGRVSHTSGVYLRARLFGILVRAFGSGFAARTESGPARPALEPEPQARAGVPNQILTSSFRALPIMQVGSNIPRTVLAKFSACRASLWNATVGNMWVACCLCYCYCCGVLLSLFAV